MYAGIIHDYKPRQSRGLRLIKKNRIFINDGIVARGHPFRQTEKIERLVP
jgi:hypothetical protein